jgi:hypothetical protein
MALPPFAANFPVSRTTGLAIAPPAFPTNLVKNSAERRVAFTARPDIEGLLLLLLKLTRSTWSCLSREVYLYAASYQQQSRECAYFSCSVIQNTAGDALPVSKAARASRADIAVAANGQLKRAAPQHANHVTDGGFGPSTHGNQNLQARSLRCG